MTWAEAVYTGSNPFCPCLFCMHQAEYKEQTLELHSSNLGDEGAKAVAEGLQVGFHTPSKTQNACAFDTMMGTEKRCYCEYILSSIFFMLCLAGGQLCTIFDIVDDVGK